MNIKHIILTTYGIIVSVSAYAVDFPTNAADISYQQRLMLNANEYKMLTGNPYAKINVNSVTDLPQPTEEPVSDINNTPDIINDIVFDITPPPADNYVQQTDEFTQVINNTSDIVPVVTPVQPTYNVNTATVPSAQWGTVKKPFVIPADRHRGKCNVRTDYNLSDTAFKACVNNVPSTKDAKKEHGECCWLDIVEDMAKRDCGTGSIFEWTNRCYFVAGPGRQPFYDNCYGKPTYFDQNGFNIIRTKHPQTLNKWENYCGLAWRYINEWCKCDK